MKIMPPSHLLAMLLAFGFSEMVTAQNISVVRNPNRPDIFAWMGSGALSGFTGNSIIFNKTLVIEYNPGSSSNLSQIKQQLAVYNYSDSLRLIPNPDVGQGVSFQASKIIFNNKLFFIYLAVGGAQRLASFDGNSITLYPNPDASASGVIGSFRILNNDLYLAYHNSATVTQLARFNGTGITPIANPDNSVNGFFNNFSTVFGNKIVSKYVTAAGPRTLAVFDGTQWTVLPNPDNTTRGVQPVFPTVYKNKLFFTYLSNTNQYQLLQYDGVANPTLIANPQNSGTNTGGVTGSFQIVANDTLFLQYRDVNNVYRLGKFGGTAISLVPNPDATTYGYWFTPVVYNDKLFIMYLPADGSRRIAQYKQSSNSLVVFANPDAGAGYWDQPIVYLNKLYIKYSNAQSVFQLAGFDGFSLQLINNPPGIYNSSAGYNGYLGQPIVWNDTLYYQMGSVPYGYAGNLTRYFSDVISICPGSSTQFVSNLAGNNYQWQVNNGSGNFTNLSSTAPYSNVSTNMLTLTAPATSFYGYEYRCVVNGNINSRNFVLKFANSWSGGVSTAWENSANWSCGSVPDANTDVYIDKGKVNYPLLSSSRSVKSIRQQSGTTIEVANGQQLLVTGK